MSEKNYSEIRRLLEGKPLTITLYGNSYKTKFEVARYYKVDQVCLQLVEEDTGENFATLSVCFPEVTLQEHEVIIKNWSENEEIAEAAFTSGLFEDTGKRISSGFVQAPIWKVMCEEG